MSNHLSYSLHSVIEVLTEEKSKLEQQLSEAYSKIKEMECCGNCGKYRHTMTKCLFNGCAIDGHYVTYADKCEKWEMK